jgi:hypothetical protein
VSHKVEIKTNEHGEPVVTFTVVGVHDIFRWAWHMVHGQVEFGRDGAHCLQHLRRRLGPKRYDEFDQTMTGGKSRSYSIRPKRDW